jgi:hypothetical protein
VETFLEAGVEVKLEDLTSVAKKGDARGVARLKEAYLSRNSAPEKARELMVEMAAARCKDGQAAREALGMFHAPDVGTRLKGFRGLPSEDCVSETLLAGLKDPDAKVRHEALLQIDIKKHFAAVIPLLRDPDTTVRQSAAYLFWYTEVTEAGAPLVRALKDSDPEVRTAAARSLGYLRYAPAVPALIAALGQAKLKPYAIDALGRIGDARAIPALGAALRDPNAEYRDSAAAALGQIRESSSLRLLLAELGSNPRDAISRALGEYGPDAISGILTLLRQGSPRTRFHAAQALGKIRDPQAQEALASAFERKELFIIAGAHEYFIEQGWPGTEETLVVVLEWHFSVRMLEGFLNSGNRRLREAAERQAKRREIMILNILSGGGGPSWGSRR